tara:strand:- start:173 stop:316 length:144 start_codon:yes stop_codon:yes gene_type:complete
MLQIKTTELFMLNTNLTKSVFIWKKNVLTKKDELYGKEKKRSPNSIF